MMVRLPTFATYPGSTIVTLGHALPKTAVEAKRLARQTNEAAHQKRQAELEEQIRKNREAAGTLRSAHPSGSGRGRLPAGRHGGPRLDPSAVYRARAEAAQPPQAKVTRPAPRRPRTIRDLARAYYDGSTGAEALIPSGPRGGAS